MGYLVHFIVYFLAMIGIIILAVFVYNKCNLGTTGMKNTRSLKVEDTLSLSPRKTLYVIRSGNERFLIAGDMDRTALISKLENESGINSGINTQTTNIRRSVDLSERAIKQQDNVAPINKPIMKEIRQKLNF